jgi:hypothetical protein
MNPRTSMNYKKYEKKAHEDRNMFLKLNPTKDSTSPL